MSVKSIGNLEKVQEFASNRVSNRCCAVARIMMGAAFTTLFSVKSTLFTVLKTLSRVNRDWHTTWKNRTDRSYRATGYSLALTLQGVRQFLWYSTAQASNASLKRDVQKLGTSLGYELMGEDNWEKNELLLGRNVPFKQICKAVVGIYPKKED